MLQEASPADASKGCHCGAAKTGEPCTCSSTETPQRNVFAASYAKPGAATAAGAPPPHDSLSLRPGEFSTGLCECTSGPQAAFICATAMALPCFAHSIVWDGAHGGGQKAPCARYALLSFLPAFIPYIGGVVSSTSRVVLGYMARAQLRAKYSLPVDDVGGAFLCLATGTCTPLRRHALSEYARRQALHVRRPLYYTRIGDRFTLQSLLVETAAVAVQTAACTSGATRARRRRRCGTFATARARSRCPTCKHSSERR
jgi:hypothetical protein